MRTNFYWSGARKNTPRISLYAAPNFFEHIFGSLDFLMRRHLMLRAKWTENEVYIRTKRSFYTQNSKNIRFFEFPDKLPEIFKISTLFCRYNSIISMKYIKYIEKYMQFDVCKQIWVNFPKKKN